MSNHDDIDARLVAQFEQEHRHVPADAFVATTMRKVRAGSRRREVTHIALRAVVLASAVAASPWLIAGVARLNAALESSHIWTLGLPGGWVLGALAVIVVLVARVRRGR